VRSLIASILIAPMVVGFPAFAQGNPTADQIINSLRPAGNLVQGGTRGIRIAVPAPEAAAPAQAAPTPAPAPAQPRLAANRPVPVPEPVAVQHAPAQPTAAATSGPSINLTVNFETGSAKLTPDAMHTLDELGRALASQELATYRFRIEGHTDTVGT